MFLTTFITESFWNPEDMFLTIFIINHGDPIASIGPEAFLPLKSGPGPSISLTAFGLFTYHSNLHSVTYVMFYGSHFSLLLDSF